ncbi:MAG: peptide ABC transporter substrate-binding protein [Thermomicrobiales bacterium]
MTTAHPIRRPDRDGHSLRNIAGDVISRRTLLARATTVGAVAFGGRSAFGTSATLANRLGMANAMLQGEKLANEQVVRLPESEPISLDPGITRGAKGLEQMQNLFEGLVYLDQRDGSLQMGLAEKMEPNADASEFTFTLREGLVWSDERPLNAHDFEWSWKRALDPTSEYTTALYPVKGAAAIVQGEGSPNDLGVVALDNITLKVTLEGPTPYFPLLATTWTFYPVPRHVIEVEGDGWTEAGKMVSNGPYVLTSWKHEQSMVLERNPAYYGEKPVITRVDYTLFADDAAQALVPFENDELDQAQVSFVDLGRVKDDPELSALMQVFPRSGTRFVVCDTTNAPTADVRVRQALSLAVGRDILTTAILKGAFLPAQTMLPPDIPGHNPDATLGEDVAKAKQLLAEAGFPAGHSFPELTLVYHGADLAERTTAEYLQAIWRKNLGIEVMLDPMEEAAYQNWFDSRKDQAFNLMVYQWGSDWPDPANWHNQLFDSRADFYHAHWKNDDFDRLVREAAEMPDAAARIAQYRQAETILVADAPLIPLYNLDRTYVIKPNIRGIYHYPVLGRTWNRYISVVES